MDSLDIIVKNSFRNFHAKGLDYLCLERTPQLTRKVYFFDGDMSKLPEVVIPHDHRYDFKTKVLSGTIQNRFYALNTRGGEEYQRFDFMTPLNGGDGFEWKETVKLRCTADQVYKKDQVYWRSADEIHTLQIASDNCVIILDQYEDRVALDQPTSAFKKDKKTPNLSGLYDKMTLEHAQVRLNQVKTLLGLW